MTDGKWPLIPDIKNLTQWVNRELKDNKQYKLLLEELKKAGRDVDNIEDVLSFIRGLFQVAKGGNVRGFSEKDLSDLEKKICEKIVEKMDVELPDVGDHQEGPRTNHAGSVGDVTMRRNLLKENVVLS
ncbi:MAG: hypothetical protein KAR32_01260 [Candidatus Omnitrophica bacterium]|nr:hypothetical protein [Candidatus Omnitrophota bacterium]